LKVSSAFFFITDVLVSRRGSGQIAQFSADCPEPFSELWVCCVRLGAFFSAVAVAQTKQKTHLNKQNTRHSAVVPCLTSNQSRSWPLIQLSLDRFSYWNT